ncbi:hypothetical protein [Kineococcus xinjiangensis]|uniref:hypothetical protein n=1 Tax=Kineococcus xinjiangensis TaxID=512762 RepID=UPI0011B0E48F|nr:hypothetical protein [Kineococcus xinjiangensis]
MGHDEDSSPSAPAGPPGAGEEQTGRGDAASQAARLGVGLLLAALSDDADAQSVLIADVPPRQGALSAVFCAQFAASVLDELPPAQRAAAQTRLRTAALLLQTDPPVGDFSAAPTPPGRSPAGHVGQQPPRPPRQTHR